MTTDQAIQAIAQDVANMSIAVQGILQYQEWIHRCIVGYATYLIPGVFLTLIFWWVIKQFIR